MYTPTPEEDSGVQDRAGPPKDLSDWVSKRFKRPLALALTKQLPPDIKHLLAANKDDLRFVQKTISRYVPKFIGTGFAGTKELGKLHGQFLAEVLEVIAEEQKSETSEQKHRQELSAKELLQMQRIQTELLNIGDQQKRERFMAWYSALSLEQRSYFHVVTAGIGSGMLAEVMQEDPKKLDEIIDCDAAGTEEKQAGTNAALRDEVERDPQLKKKVDSYLKHLGSSKVSQFWCAVQDKLQGDARQLDFLLNLPHEQVDSYLGLAGSGSSSQWSDILPDWLRGLFK
jgi:hypothetical protein